MDLTDRRAAEAVAVESRALEELEAEEAAETLVPDTSLEGLALQLSPSTWGALEDVPDGFWETTLDPALLERYLGPTPS
jgi:hypothetical protein